MLIWVSSIYFTQDATFIDFYRELQNCYFQQEDDFWLW